MPLNPGSSRWKILTVLLKLMGLPSLPMLKAVCSLLSIALNRLDWELEAI